MQNLRNATILIGKEPEHGRLMIVLTIAGKTKASAIGAVGSVDNCVSRCYPKENIAHCKIEIDDKGTMRLTNMKMQNSTFVGNTEIMSKVITPNSDIYLGYKRWKLPFDQVQTAVKELAKALPQPPKEFYIDHLESVWESYHQELKYIKDKQKNLQLLTRVPMLFSMGSGAIAAISQELRSIALPGTVIAFVIMLYGITKTKRTDSDLEQEEATKKFQRSYVCPNPECRHFVGKKDYEILKQDKNCPYCKCKWLKK